MTAPNPPFDQGQLDLIRRFLRQHFPGSNTVETFERERTAQQFVVNPQGPRRHVLLVMRDALDHPDLAALLDERLVDALEHAGDKPVSLTAQGARY
jgi:hypothetical protein